MTITHSLSQNETTNAVLVCGFLAIVLLAAVVSVVTDAILWAIFSVAAVGLIALPAMLTRDWQVMVPWPLALFVALPVTVRTLGYAPEITGYFAISGLALVTVVEIDAFTAVEMSRRVAVLFAALTTLAFQSWWIVGQYYSDKWLGTDFITTQTELQWDLLAVTVVTLAMGAIFLWYFDHVEHVGGWDRPVVPEEEP
jgi:hypothetical protein